MEKLKLRVSTSHTYAEPDLTWNPELTNDQIRAISDVINSRAVTSYQ